MIMSENRHDWKSKGNISKLSLTLTLYGKAFRISQISGGINVLMFSLCNIILEILDNTIKAILFVLFSNVCQFKCVKHWYNTAVVSLISHNITCRWSLHSQFRIQNLSAKDAKNYYKIQVKDGPLVLYTVSL